MSRGMSIGLVVVLVLLVVVGSGSVFTVHEARQALVLEFGRPVKVVTEPGLYFKIPIAQDVTYFERRILEIDNAPEEVIASDQKRIVVDTFARYRISDALKFFQSVGTEAVARTRLSALINAAMRQVIGEVRVPEVVSGDRAALMAAIRFRVNTESQQFGITVIDVRIKRADLPEANSQAVYQRMQTEREREAKEIRANGEKRSVQIKARANRDRVVTIAGARKTSEILRGEGEGEATRIFADAYGQDAEFFAFYRSMEAYREALGSDDTTMVLSPDSEFFRYFGSTAGLLKDAK